MYKIIMADAGRHGLRILSFVDKDSLKEWLRRNTDGRNIDKDRERVAQGIYHTDDSYDVDSTDDDCCDEDFVIIKGETIACLNNLHK